MKNDVKPPTDPAGRDKSPRHGNAIPNFLLLSLVLVALLLIATSGAAAAIPARRAARIDPATAIAEE